MFTWKRYCERDGAMKFPASRFDGKDGADGASLFKNLFSATILDLRHR